MQFTANLRHLAALLEITRLGSINKAAEAVHLSQSALTQGLGKIENELGLTLFDRAATGMFPNSAGLTLLNRLQRGFQYLKSFEKELNAEANSHRQIHLSFSKAQLRAVIATVEQRNISLAAATLSLAQPTIQRAVREVESICGQPLFSRSATGVDPSPTARKLALLSSLAFAEIQAGFEEVHQTQGKMTGRLVIGSLPLARTDLVPATVTELLQRSPAVQVSIIDGPYDELLHGLAHGRIHLIIGALRDGLPTRNLTQECLFNDPLSVIVRKDHPLLNKKNLQLKNLNTLDWIAPRLETPARSRFQAIFLRNNLSEPEPVLECSSSVAIRGLLLRSDRLALLSRRQVQPEIDAGYLAVLPLTLKNSARPIGLTLRKDWRATTAQQQYLQILREACAAYTDSDHG
jgi:DNA-binding transcriptional LysR family regulator